MKSLVLKHSVLLAGQKTSGIAATRNMTLCDLIGSVDLERHQGNLSSALRLFVLNHYQGRVAVSH
jgi:predicted DNA-binding ribbon-helix-helix protein